MGAVQILGVVVLIIGILLIGVEFYMPGFGFPGIAGIIFTAAGIFLTGKSMQERVIIGVIAIVIIAVMLVISIVIFGSKKVKSPIKLDEDLQGKNLFIEEKDMEYLIRWYLYRPDEKVCCKQYEYQYCQSYTIFCSYAHLLLLRCLMSLTLIHLSYIMRIFLIK